MMRHSSWKAAAMMMTMIAVLNLQVVSLASAEEMDVADLCCSRAKEAIHRQMMLIAETVMIERSTEVVG